MRNRGETRSVVGRRTLVETLGVMPRFTRSDEGVVRHVSCSGDRRSARRSFTGPRPKHRALDDAVQGRLDRYIALARDRLEPGSIDDRDPTAVVPDETRDPKTLCGQGHRGSTRTEHLTEELMGDGDLVGAEPVVAPQL